MFSRLSLPQLPPTLSRAFTGIHASWRTASAFCSQRWIQHDERMQSNPIYRTVVSALAAVLARQMNLRRLLLAILTAIINAAGRSKTRQARVRPSYYDVDADIWPYD